MKKHSVKFGFLGALILSAVGINMAYADNLCDDPDAVHCAMMNGHDTKTFRSILVVVQNAVAQKICVNNTLNVDLYKEDIENLIKAGIINGLSPGNPVNMDFKYFQCGDQTCGTNSRTLGDDKYVISVDSNGNYNSNPQYFNIRVFDPTYGAPCVPSGKIKSLSRTLLEGINNKK